MGNPVPQNFLYTNIKQLLERIAPVMIDSSAIVALVTHIESILPTGDADDAEADRLGDSENLESGMKLLLVSIIPAFILNRRRVEEQSNDLVSSLVSHGQAVLVT